MSRSRHVRDVEHARAGAHAHVLGGCPRTGSASPSPQTAPTSRRPARGGRGGACAEACRCGLQAAQRLPPALLLTHAAQASSSAAITPGPAPRACGATPRSTHSWGAWAPPPRGPRPSSVTAIPPAATWLASLRRRARCHDRAAEPLGRTGDQVGGRRARVHPRPGAHQRARAARRRAPPASRRAPGRAPRAGRRAGRRGAAAGRAPR